MVATKTTTTTATTTAAPTVTTAAAVTTAQPNSTPHPRANPHPPTNLVRTRAPQRRSSHFNVLKSCNRTVQREAIMQVSQHSRVRRMEAVSDVAVS